MAGDCGRWDYTGDVSLEHGGAYYDLSTFSEGYVDAVRVTDMGSACGFNGVALIEHITVIIGDPEQTARALESCYGGAAALGARNWKATGCSDVKRSLRLAIADALANYGYSDPDDGWNGYNSAGPGASETVRYESSDDSNRHGESITIDKRIRGDLEAYVKAVHLGHKTPVQQLRQTRSIRPLPFKRDADPGIVADWLDDIGESAQAAEMRRSAGIACGS